MKCDDPIRDRSKSHSRPVDRLRTVLPARSVEWLSQAHGHTSAEFARCPSSAVALQWFSDRPPWVRRARKYTCRTEYPVLSFWVLGFELVGSRSRATGRRGKLASLTRATPVARERDLPGQTQNSSFKTQDSKPKTSYTNEESGNIL